MSSKPVTDLNPECSLVIPVYRNEGNISSLLDRLAVLNSRIPGGLYVVLVADGNPDASYSKLKAALGSQVFSSKLLLLSRNFGSFAAIRAGLAEVDTPHMAVMSADLQEPAELFETFFSRLRTGEVDILLASRAGRADPWLDRITSSIFWTAYRRFIQSDLPAGGVDVFACSAAYRDHLLKFSESNSSLIGQLLWLGFRREDISYKRQTREIGRSAWTFRRKLRYLSDSVFSFTDLPIRMFLILGSFGLAICTLLVVVIAVAKLSGLINVPGYTATVLTVLFFAALNLFGLGIIGSYVWRAFENTKQRPLAVVMRRRTYSSNSTHGR